LPSTLSTPFTPPGAAHFACSIESWLQLSPSDRWNWQLYPESIHPRLSLRAEIAGILAAGFMVE
jgi:hypothetical protein